MFFVPKFLSKEKKENLLKIKKNSLTEIFERKKAKQKKKIISTKV